MTGPHDLDALLGSWMESDGPEDVPSALVQRSLRDARRVKQQSLLRGAVLGWPSRWGGETLARRHRGAVPRLAVVLLTLVLLIVLVAGGLLVSGQLMGPVSPVPSPSPTPSPALMRTVFGALEPGTYALRNIVGDPDRPLQRMSVTVPDGWSGIGGRSFANLFQDSVDDPTGNITIHLVSNFFIDPCDTGAGMWEPPLGPTVDAFVTAVGDVPGYEVTAPTDVTWLGYPGTYLELTAPASVADCGEGFAHAWNTEYDETAQYLIDGQHERVWVVDVDGTRLVISLTAGHAAPRPTGTDPASLAEQQAVFDSLRIAPAPSPTATPTASGEAMSALLDAQPTARPSPMR